MLGLVILAVVSSLVETGDRSLGEVGGIGGSIGLGQRIAPHSSRWLARIDAGLLSEPVFLKDFQQPAIVREIELLLSDAETPGLAARLRPISTTP